jgi:hypothetical protein
MYEVIAFPSERRLKFSKKEPPFAFLMEKGW